MRPTTGFPPGYSLSLAVFKWLGFDLHAGARLLGGLGFSILVLLAGVGVGAVTGSPGFGLMSAALVLGSPTLIGVHGWALSESVFLPMSLAAILFTTGFLGTGESKYLVLGGLAVGMAALTRYAGLSLAVALGACLALGHGNANPKRWRVMGVFAGLALGPLIVFLVRNVIVSGDLVNRPEMTWRPPEAALIERAGAIMVSWLVPFSGVRLPGWLSTTLAGVLLLCLILGTSWGLRAVKPRPRDKTKSPALWLLIALGTHSTTYLAVLYTSMSVADPNIRSGFSAVGERLLAPVHLDLMVLIPLWLFVAWRGSEAPGRLLVIGTGLLFLVAQFSGGIKEAGELREDGRGFNSVAWRSSAAMAYIRELPEIPIYTNEVGATYLLTGRHATFIPASYNPSTQSNRLNYSADLDRMRRTIRAGGGILAILGSGPRDRLTPEYLDELTEGLTLVEEFGDGLIYRYTGDH